MRAAFVLGLGALTGAAIIATWHGAPSQVSLESVRRLWSDALRDADQAGLHATRLSTAEEMRLGDALAALAGWPEPPDAVGRAARVAAPLLAHRRRPGIEYRFREIGSPQANAFALPGGRILVTTALLELAASDDELAEVLGHEIAHIDLRHAVERYQYQQRLGSLFELAHRVASLPYSSDQELDADAEGLRLMIAAGYDPAAAPAMLERLLDRGEVEAKPDTPAGEIAQSLAGLIGSLWRTHPPTAQRVAHLRELVRRAKK